MRKINFRRQMEQWLKPGLGVKRWLGLIILGNMFIGLGLAVLLLNVYRTAPDTWWLPLLSAASLRFLPRWLRALIFGSIGFGIMAWGLWGLSRSLLAPFLRPGKPVVETIAAYRLRERGPHVVAIGGGHGLATLLRGLKKYTHNITAVVTVADDGGSSGRLRRSLGVLPPGDIRNCLAALSNDEALLTQLFQYRFADGGGELDGHAFGNLFISALSAITGSFEEAIAESGRVLSVHGRVLPATLRQVNLAAEVELPHQSAGVRVVGESRIPEMPGRIRRVWLEPEHPPAFPKAIQAILAADMVVVGPGSLYTSILPNLLVPDIAAALRATRAFRVYVCNVATQPGETDGFSCQDHIAALEAHVGEGLFDLVLVNNAMHGTLPEGVQWVRVAPDKPLPYPVHAAPLSDPEHPARHNADALAHTLMRLLEERTGPLG
ncbi:MAG: YvcK family protein [Chloroflexi bacterium]|nr:YvcK family protein [Chloroflexota bacterium]